MRNSSHCYIFRSLFIAILLFIGIAKAMAHSFPPTEGNRLRYNVQIDIRNAYISGVCLMLTENGIVKASIVNEFGVSAMDFTYSPEKDKVKLISVMSKLDKWYIRKLLKKDLREVMHCLQNGQTRYDDQKFHISYTFTPEDSASASAASRIQHEKIRLWDGTKVKAKSVTLEAFLPDSLTQPATAVIVCPGGSYCWHDMETEGIGVARWLQMNGIAAFILNYRVQGKFQYVTHSRLLIPGRQYPMPQEDLQMAIQYVRQNAERFGIDKNRVGAMGFSAGGHLVMSAAELFHTDFLSPHDINVTESLRPDFVAPIYPVVTMRERVTHKRSRRALLGDWRKGNKILRDSLSLECHVPDDCPPVFLVNCKDDPVVKYHNSELLDSALTAKGIRHRYIQYNTGGHGFGASDVKGTAECRQWRDEFLKWIREW